MTSKDLGLVTAYAYAVSQGYTGTEEEFAELMASYATVAEEAAESAAEAAASATAAGASETNAASSAASANQSATSAGNSATSASGSAVQAQSSATAAGQSATQAAGSATAAGNSATAAAGSATQAAASETAAGASATAAAGSATSAASSATAAAGSATEADASADRAQEILDSIPEDYSELSEDVANLSSALNALDDVVIEHPTAEYRKADVRSGSLQPTGNYSTDSTGFGIGYKMPLAANEKLQFTPHGPEGYKYSIRFLSFADETSSGTLSQTAFLSDDSYTYTQPADKAYLMWCIYYKHSDGTYWHDILDEFADADVLVKTEIITEVIPLARIDDIESIQDQLTEQAETLEFDHSYSNILQGASTFEDNKFISNNGMVTSNSNFCLIDGYFPVKPNTTYKLYRDEPPLYSNAGHNWAFWDANKNFLSYTLSGQPVTSPSNAAYLRFAVYISSTGSATHQDFDPTKVVITEDGNPTFDDVFIKTSARPTFNGLKWVGIGDSITEDNFRATYHYWSYIVAETGLNFVNMGVSGTGYKSEGSGDKAFYKRVPSMATDADAITIFGGVNDVVLSNATIGTETDTGTDTICGCVNTTLDRIETLYPAHMPIGIITPLPCACVDTSVNLHPVQNPADDSCRMAQFVEQLALICKHRGIPFLDLFHQSNLRPWHQECNAKYFSCDSAKAGDGLHPNGHGHRLIYRQIMQFVEKLVMN